MSDRSLLVGLTASVAAGLLAYKLHKDKKTQPSLPPSPKSYPLIGHLLSVPNEYEHLGFMKLGEHLGSKIFSLTVLGTTIVVLNDKDDAANLLDKRSTMYSDRNCPPMVQEPSLFGWGDFGSLVGYGERWRKYRRLMNPWLTKQAVTVHHDSQEQATRKLLRRLLNSDKDVMSSHELEAELFLSVSATLLRAIYGYEAEDTGDEFLVGARRVFSYLTRSLLSSNYLVNSLPALMYIPEWFPGAGWKRDAIKWRKEKDALIRDMYNIGLENMRKNGSAHIMVASLKRQALDLGLTEVEADDYVGQIAITMFAGGTDTVCTILTDTSGWILVRSITWLLML
ncbi:unnamed protein product [Rhizoctonia solani]|uniref:O-methylsterigmatocystin oxidoreductase n=1 Tax=Rhizoctonia solani TaxID=456999 RepID=A0A8H3HBW8_9AGAM|nr:unnamed protein product [Rhizoctonia solani]